MSTPPLPNDVEIDPGRSQLRPLLTLAWPVVMSRLGIMVMGLTDTIVVGRYSADELAYHSLGWAPTMVVVTTAIGLLLGVQVLTAQLVGERRAGEAGSVLRRGIVFAAVVGILSSGGLYLGADALMSRMGLVGNLAPESAAVVRILALSLTPYLIAVACQFWLEALKKPVPAMIIMWGANILNLALSLWLVPGDNIFGIDGAVAAGWTTLGARTALLCGLIGFIFTWPEARSKFGLLVRGTGRYWRELFRIGFAAAASLFVETAGFAAMNIVAGQIGALTVAGFAILLNIAAMVFMVPLGLASATAVLVGNGFGERDFDRVRAGGWTGIGFTAALMTAIAIIVWLLDAPIVSVFTTEAELTAMLVPAVALAAFFFTMDGLQVVASNALRAMDDVWLPTLTHTISYVGVMLPLGWWLAVPVGMGLSGLVWAIIAASISAGGFLIARFAWLTRKGAALRLRRDSL
ncbi:MAG: MATE family efflux transporter [Pacificimonas sp.]